MAWKRSDKAKNLKSGVMEDFTEYGKLYCDISDETDDVELERDTVRDRIK